ncbi:50S ribosomal protein L21 [Candidatus Curtissbacteria bacterium]|nr:50S ribosomal protein L21 [Candidatus Curtissbacteria bacterium]
MWAIIQTGGKQYKVEEGETVIVEKLDGDKAAKVFFDKVLAIGGDKLSVGTPFLEKAKVNGKILETFRDRKVTVVKFKSKSRYLRRKGHRQHKTKVVIEKIVSPS